MAAAYLDQLDRSQGLEAALAGRARAAVDQWRGGRPDQAAALSTEIAAAAGKAAGPDATRLRALAELFGRLGAG